MIDTGIAAWSSGGAYVPPKGPGLSGKPSDSGGFADGFKKSDGSAKGESFYELLSKRGGSANSSTDKKSGSSSEESAELIQGGDFAEEAEAYAGRETITFPKPAKKPAELIKEIQEQNNAEGIPAVLFFGINPAITSPEYIVENVLDFNGTAEPQADITNAVLKDFTAVETGIAQNQRDPQTNGIFGITEETVQKNRNQSPAVPETTETATPQSVKNKTGAVSGKAADSMPEKANPAENFGITEELRSDSLSQPVKHGGTAEQIPQPVLTAEQIPQTSEDYRIKPVKSGAEEADSNNGLKINPSVNEALGKIKVVDDSEFARKYTRRNDGHGQDPQDLNGEPEALNAFISHSALNLKKKPEELEELLESLKTVGEGETRETPDTKAGHKSLSGTQPEAPESLGNLGALETSHANRQFVVKTNDKNILPHHETVRISDEIMARMSKGANGDVTFEMTLNPAELGKITIKLVLRESRVAAEITAQKASTADMLQNTRGRLQENLGRSDVKLEEIIVKHKEDYGEHYEQQRENQKQNRNGYERDSEDDETDGEGISFAELIQSM